MKRLADSELHSIVSEKFLPFSASISDGMRVSIRSSFSMNRSLSFRTHDLDVVLHKRLRGYVVSYRIVVSIPVVRLCLVVKAHCK